MGGRRVGREEEGEGSCEEEGSEGMEREGEGVR